MIASQFCRGFGYSILTTLGLFGAAAADSYVAAREAAMVSSGGTALQKSAPTHQRGAAPGAGSAGAPPSLINGKEAEAVAYHTPPPRMRF